MGIEKRDRDTLRVGSFSSGLLEWSCAPARSTSRPRIANFPAGRKLRLPASARRHTHTRLPIILPLIRPSSGNGLRLRVGRLNTTSRLPLVVVNHPRQRDAATISPAVTELNTCYVREWPAFRQPHAPGMYNGLSTPPSGDTDGHHAEV